MSRGDGSVNTFLGVQCGLAMGSIDMLGQRGAEAALAARRWPVGKDRRVRADRAEPRFGFGGAGDHGAPRRRPLGAQRRQALDRQRQHRATWSIVWARDEEDGKVKGSSWRRIRRHLSGRLHRRADHRQDRQARHLAAGHHVAGRPGAGRQRTGRGPLVPGCDPGVDLDPRGSVVGVGRPRGGRVRGSAHVCDAASAVRETDRRIPAGAKQVGEHAGRTHLHPADVLPDGTAAGGGQTHRATGVAGQDGHCAEGSLGLLTGPGHPGWQRICCWTSTSLGI